MLELRDVVCRYGQVTALKGVSLTVGKGQLVALIGANGAGKTTTLKAISGLLHPSAGSIVFDGRDITHASARTILSLRLAHCPEGRHVFLTERAAPMTTAGFRKMFARVGEGTEFPFPVHPHMLRHACGYKLANDGQDTRAVQHYLGHKNIQHTVRYTQLSPERFNSFWDD